MVMSLVLLFSFTLAAAIMHILCQANSLQTRADLVGIVSASDTSLNRKWNHCHTAIGLGDRNGLKRVPFSQPSFYL